jgi:hypothetical protein
MSSLRRLNEQPGRVYQGGYTREGIEVIGSERAKLCV